MGVGASFLPEPNKTKNSKEGENDYLKFASTEMQGWRANMQDSSFAFLSVGENPNNSLFAVLDGHGGKLRMKLLIKFYRERSG